MLPHIVIIVLTSGYLTDSCEAGPVHFLKEIPLCGNDTQLDLSETSFESSRIITLEPDWNDYCTLVVKAPSTHVIHLQILEDHERLHHIHTSVQMPCELEIVLQGNIQIWKGDLCSTGTLTQGDLLSRYITLRWIPSYDVLQTKGRKIVVTAIGTDSFCEKEGQHACMRVGAKPIFCISEVLTCDGHQHCPQGSKTGDEDKICEGDLSKIWKRKFIGLMNKLPPNVANTIRKDLENSTELPVVLSDLEKSWTHFKKIATIEVTTTIKPDVHYGSLDNFLSHYGPWGYICLVVILCGSVLIMCGLWECCARYKKNICGFFFKQQTIDVVIVNGANGYEHEETASQSNAPPNYVDIGPPSYSDLFPVKTTDNEELTASETIRMNSIRNNPNNSEN